MLKSISFFIILSSLFILPGCAQKRVEVDYSDKTVLFTCPHCAKEDRIPLSMYRDEKIVICKFCDKESPARDGVSGTNGLTPQAKTHLGNTGNGVLWVIKALLIESIF